MTHSKSISNRRTFVFSPISKGLDAGAYTKRYYRLSLYISIYISAPFHSILAFLTYLKKYLPDIVTT